MKAAEVAKKVARGKFRCSIPANADPILQGIMEKVWSFTANCNNLVLLFFTSWKTRYERSSQWTESDLNQIFEENSVNWVKK